LPESALLLYTYIRKEAVLSSKIEGTQSSLSDLLLFELEQQPGVPLEDVSEVSRYVTALDHGITRLGEGFPLSLRLIREIHAILLSKGRGSRQMPGEFRTSQNWIGGTRPGNAVFVPPPPEYVQECMGQLELFLHDQPEPTPVLLKAALAHLQFETIHPFLDGNGRVGRLLIPLLLCDRKILTKPMLYLSLFFKTHRERYYELLGLVRKTGEWEAWLDFFADAVETTANQGVAMVQNLLELARTDRKTIAQFGRAAESALAIHHVLMERPIATAGWIVKQTGITATTVYKSLDQLENAGIVRELTTKRRNRLFSYSGFIKVLDEDTE
jgi:Fic family protein